MDEKYTVKKVYIRMRKLLLLGYISVLLVLNVLKPHNKASFDEVFTFLGLMLAGIPLIIFLILCLLYCFNMFSNKYTFVRKQCYLNVLLYSFPLILVFAPNHSFFTNHLLTINIFILILFVVNIYTHNRIQDKLASVNFSLSHEISMSKKINEVSEKTEKHKWSQIFNKLSALFVIAYIVSNSDAFFINITLFLALSGLYPLYKMVQSYCQLKSIIRINPVCLYVNYALSIGLSLPLYVWFPFKLPAIICLLSYNLMKHILDNRFGRYLYELLEDNLGESFLYIDYK